MRLVTPGDTAPASVNRYLLPGERQVITVRLHPAILLGPIIIVLVGLVIAGVLTSSIAKSNHGALDLIWFIWALLLARLIWKVANWSVDFFVLSSKRLLLNKVTDMRFERSMNGRFLGYGTFILETAGQDQAFREVDFIPYPEQLYLEVCGMIMPESVAVLEKDESDD